MSKLSLNLDQRAALNFIVAIMVALEIYLSFMLIHSTVPYNPEISDLMLIAPLIGAFFIVLIIGLITRIPGLIVAGIVPDLILGVQFFLPRSCIKGCMMMGLIFFGVSLIFALFAPGWAIAILKKAHFLNDKTLLYLRIVKIITMLCPLFLLIPLLVFYQMDILVLVFISILVSQFYIVPTIVYSCVALKSERA